MRQKNQDFRPLTDEELDFIAKMINRKGSEELALDFPIDRDTIKKTVDIAVKFDNLEDPKFTTVILRRKMSSRNALFVGTAKRNTHNYKRIVRRRENGMLINDKVVEMRADKFDFKKGFEIALVRAITTQNLTML